jgi:hypothetical protein
MHSGREIPTASHRCGLAAGRLGAVPHHAVVIATQVTGWNSDKNRERRWHPASPVLIAATGLLAPSVNPAQFHSSSYSSPMACPRPKNAEALRLKNGKSRRVLRMLGYSVEVRPEHCQP